jgi:hypothetical protein
MTVFHNEQLNTLQPFVDATQMPMKIESFSVLVGQTIACGNLCSKGCGCTFLVNFSSSEAGSEEYSAVLPEQSVYLVWILLCVITNGRLEPTES